MVYPLREVLLRVTPLRGFWGGFFALLQSHLLLPRPGCLCDALGDGACPVEAREIKMLWNIWRASELI